MRCAAVMMYAVLAFPALADDRLPAREGAAAAGAGGENAIAPTLTQQEAERRVALVRFGARDACRRGVLSRAAGSTAPMMILEFRGPLTETVEGDMLVMRGIASVQNGPSGRHLATGTFVCRYGLESRRSEIELGRDWSLGGAMW